MPYCHFCLTKTYNTIPNANVSSTIICHTLLARNEPRSDHHITHTQKQHIVIVKSRLRTGLDLNTKDVRAEKLAEPVTVLSCNFCSFLSAGQRDTIETAINFCSSSKDLVFKPVSFLMLVSSHTHVKDAEAGIEVLTRDTYEFPGLGSWL